MDLSKISKRLRKGHYIIPNDIIRDIRLIFSNAKTYNAKGTMVRFYITSSLRHKLTSRAAVYGVCITHNTVLIYTASNNHMLL